MDFLLTLKDLNRMDLTELIKVYWKDPVTTYDDRKLEKQIEQFAPAARERGYLEQHEFYDVITWKLRSGKWGCGNIDTAKSNSTEKVKNVTQLAFSKEDRQQAIDELQELDGVDFIVATAILHFFRHDTPVYDKRLAESLIKEPPVSPKPDEYKEFAEHVIRGADIQGMTLRNFDRAIFARNAIATRRKTP